MASLSLLDRVRLDKAATDAGFDVRLGPEADWLSYASTSCPLKSWLTVWDGMPAAALSMANVLGELGVPAAPVPAPPGAAGAIGVGDFDQLQSMLARAYALANALPQQLLHVWEAQVQALPATEREAAIKQRVGQDLFRKGLLALWQGRCALTGLAVPELLRASHAKPWKVASDAERLDVFNGLLLAAHLDAAFDQGLISFGIDGKLLTSARLGPAERGLLGLDRDWPALRLRPAHEPYLSYHREHVFVRSNGGATVLG
jgi:hypothetical protein